MIYNRQSVQGKYIWLQNLGLSASARIYLVGTY